MELELHSNQFGFSVFTEQMNLAEAPGCGEDFYQFGRFNMEKRGPEKDKSLKIFLKKRTKDERVSKKNRSGNMFQKTQTRKEILQKRTDV